MVKGGALIFAIVISFVLAVLTSMLILYSYYNRLQLENIFLEDKVLSNARSGINVFLSESSGAEELNIDMFARGNDSVSLSYKNWGVFNLISSIAHSGNYTFQIHALIGYQIVDSAISLYLTDHDNPLCVAGITTINGRSFLPKEGIRRVLLGGQNYSGSVSGLGLYQSKKILPSISGSGINGIDQIFQKLYLLKDSLVEIEDNFPDTVINSFSENTIVYFSNSPIKIFNKKLIGNIKVISNVSITISSASEINDIIFSAPIINVESNFIGSMQAFANDSIVIGENCTLNYPSVLALKRTLSSNSIMKIHLSSNSILNGSAITIDKDHNSDKRSLIFIDKKALVKGQIYSSDILDLQGSVYGSIYTDNILLSNPSGYFKNHLFNATIDIAKRSKYYIGMNIKIDNESLKSGIVKWLK